eukprot:6487820-Amphidinium_carterae.1
MAKAKHETDIQGSHLSSMAICWVSAPAFGWWPYEEMATFVACGGFFLGTTRGGFYWPFGRGASLFTESAGIQHLSRVVPPTCAIGVASVELGHAEDALRVLQSVLILTSNH